MAQHNLDTRNNTVYEVTKPFNVWIRTGSVPSNAYYGSAQILKPVLRKIVAQPGDFVYSLRGGVFFSRADDDVMYYAYPRDVPFVPFSTVSGSRDVWPLDKLEDIGWDPDWTTPKIYKEDRSFTMTDVQLTLCEIGPSSDLEEWGAHISGYTFGLFADKTLVAKFSALPKALAAARKYVKDHKVTTYVRDMANGAQYFKWSPSVTESRTKVRK